METMKNQEENRGKTILPPDAEAMRKCRARWDSIAKPLEGLGRFEEMIVRIAGMQRNENVSIDKKALIVMCADNGVVAEGVSQTDSSVTAVVTDNFAEGLTSACVMSRVAGVDVFPVDVGVQTKTKVFQDKVMPGTNNIAREPAMTRRQAEDAVEAGRRAARRCREKGYQILLTGEMGIGNTTTSSAVAAVLLGEDPAVLTGKGAGLSGAALEKKKDVIRKAIELHRPDPSDPLDVLAKVGGLDIAALAGVFLEGAALGLPVVTDGFISACAALAACRMDPEVKGYILPSHMSRESGMEKIMKELKAEPVLYADMKLGEGTGAVALMPLLDMALAVYRNMPDFEGIKIEPYKPL